MRPPPRVVISPGAELRRKIMASEFLVGCRDLLPVCAKAKDTVASF
jgi:hypothetical protein